MAYCTVCGTIDDLHRKQQTLPHDPVICKLTDELFHAVLRLKHERTTTSMLEVVQLAKAFEQTNEYKVILIKKWRAVQIINLKYLPLMQSEPLSKLGTQPQFNEAEGGDLNA